MRCARWLRGTMGHSRSHAALMLLYTRGRSLLLAARRANSGFPGRANAANAVILTQPPAAGNLCPTILRRSAASAHSSACIRFTMSEK